MEEASGAFHFLGFARPPPLCLTLLGRYKRCVSCISHVYHIVGCVTEKLPVMLCSCPAPHFQLLLHAAFLLDVPPSLTPPMNSPCSHPNHRVYLPLTLMSRCAAVAQSSPLIDFTVDGGGVNDGVAMEGEHQLSPTTRNS